PDDVLKPLVTKYFQYGYSDVQIVQCVLEDVDAAKNGWTLGKHTVRRRRLSWGLLGTRQQSHTIDTIAQHVKAIRYERDDKPPGVKRTQDWLRSTLNLRVPRQLVAEYNRLYHQEEVRQRKGHRLKRKNFWTAGVFDVFCFDQHDKWGDKYGLWLHTGVEAFSGAILYINVWFTNSNPRLIFRYYLQAVRNYGGIPLLTQSDWGSENNGIANGHSFLHRLLDPSLVGTLQHQWKPGHTNIKPEGKWSQMRREFSPGYERLFQEGVSAGLCHQEDPLDKYLFRRLAVPFLQRKLDEYVHMYNSSRPRADKNKVLPVGIPNDILEHPARYGAKNFKIHVSKDELCTVEDIYAPSDHPVFELVPPTFETEYQRVYRQLGSPKLAKSNFWPVY
ncbi:hypothetical protein CALCODRAFT_404512, partial [Calocera cornea HHB12733]